MFLQDIIKLNHFKTQIDAMKKITYLGSLFFFVFVIKMAVDYFFLKRASNWVMSLLDYKWYFKTHEIDHDLFLFCVCAIMWRVKASRCFCIFHFISRRR